MARIYTYPNDTVLLDEDAWIGTNYPDLATVQFTAQKIADYLNVNAKIAVGGQLIYKYYYGLESEVGTMTLLTGPSNLAFSSITELYVHKNDKAGQTTNNYISALVGSEILISELNNVNAFGHYRLTAYLQSSGNANFYVLYLMHLNSNGTLQYATGDYTHYSISPLNLSADKHYTHNQTSASATWNVTHNLNKNPAVSVVTNNEQAYASVGYINQDSLTITFNSPQTGKAYLN